MSGESKVIGLLSFVGGVLLTIMVILGVAQQKKQFIYNDKVNIISGFYKGCSGRVVGMEGSKYLVSTTCPVSEDAFYILETTVDPEDMERVSQ